jgi:hypothetical protein
MYYKISILLNRFLHEILFLQPIMILTILFCIMNIKYSHKNKHYVCFMLIYFTVIVCLLIKQKLEGFWKYSVKEEEKS